MPAYYNEFEPYAADWLERLIAVGLLPDGDVDRRSIVDVRPDDLKGYDQCHFFAGIGGWGLALRMAGWPDDRPVWTGSCPCQPFSVAGQRKGEADERHLWPVWFDLIRECRPPVLFGEQVASALAIGAASSPVVQDMHDRETVRRVLWELKRSAPPRLQGMRARQGAQSETRETGCDPCSAEGVARSEQGACARQRGAVSGEAAGHPLFPGSRRHSAADRTGTMRNDEPAVRLDDAAGVERAVTGSDCSRRGLYAREREGGPLRAERDGEYVGTGDYFSGGGCDPTEAEEQAGQRILADFFGCSTESPLGGAWIDTVQRDLEREGYAFGMAVLGAHSVGAPHIRQRLWFVADAQRDGQHWRWHAGSSRGAEPANDGLMGHTGEPGLEGRGVPERGRAGERAVGAAGGDAGELADAMHAGRAERRPGARNGQAARSGDAGFWSDADWIACRDGKARPVEPRTFPLAHGIPGRVGRLRAYGNAIVPQVAAEFIGAYLDCRE